MDTFGAEITIKKNATDVQYCIVLCHNSIDEDDLSRVKTFINRQNLQVVFSSAESMMWVVAMKTGDIEILKRYNGIKHVGGVNIDAKKMLNILKPVVTEK